MKQKFSIVTDENNDKLVIKEYAELDKEIMSLLCEESYAGETIKAAIEEGKSSLVNTLRTKNLYPPEIFIDQIAEAVTNLYAAGGNEIVEILFDDLALMAQEKEEQEIVEDEIDDLLEDDVDDDIDDNIDDGIDIQNIKSPLKVADDDSTVVDGDA